MIIFINGSFGVGKTTLAKKLVEQLHYSLLYDPEYMGSVLQEIVRPIEISEDFQDLTAWCPMVVMGAKVLKQTYRRTLVIPMTIWHRPYLEEILDGLREVDPHIFHFCLTAKKETIYQRLHSRENKSEPLDWITQRIERCVMEFSKPAFAVQINTEGNTSDELLKEILIQIDQYA